MILSLRKLFGKRVGQHVFINCGLCSEMNVCSKARNPSNADQFILNFNRYLAPLISNFRIFIFADASSDRHFQKRRLFVAANPSFDYQRWIKFFGASGGERPVQCGFRSNRFPFEVDNQNRNTLLCQKPNPSNNHGPPVPVSDLEHDSAFLFSVLDGIQSWLSITKLKIGLHLGGLRLLEQASDCYRGSQSSCPAAQCSNPCRKAILCSIAEQVLPDRVTDNKKHTNARDNQRASPTHHAIRNNLFHNCPLHSPAKQHGAA